MNVPRLKIVVADDDAEIREYMEQLLGRLGHDVNLVESGKQLSELCRQAPPDLIIADIKMPDTDGLEAARAVNRERPTPVIVISGHQRPDLLNGDDPIMAYLVKPLKPADVEMAVAVAMSRFQVLQALRREASELRQALEDRKIVERSKGIIMRRLRVEEPEAFQRLKRLASNQNRKLVDVAQAVLTGEEIFHQLESCDLSTARKH